MVSIAQSAMNFWFRGDCKSPRIFLEYFCPDGIMVTKREEEADNLRPRWVPTQIRF